MSADNPAQRMYKHKTKVEGGARVEVDCQKVGCGVWCRVLSDSAIKSFARNSEFLSKILQINLERGIMLCHNAK